MRQVGYLQGSYQDVRSTKHKNMYIYWPLSSPNKKVKGKGKEIAVQEDEASRFRDNRHTKAAFTPQEILLVQYSFLLQAESQPQGHSAA